MFQTINQYLSSLGEAYKEAQSDVDRNIISCKIEAIDDLYKQFKIVFLNEKSDYDEWLDSA